MVRLKWEKKIRTLKEYSFQWHYNRNQMRNLLGEKKLKEHKAERRRAAKEGMAGNHLDSHTTGDGTVPHLMGHVLWGPREVTYLPWRNHRETPTPTPQTAVLGRSWAQHWATCLYREHFPVSSGASDDQHPMGLPKMRLHEPSLATIHKTRKPRVHDALQTPQVAA